MYYDFLAGLTKGEHKNMNQNPERYMAAAIAQAKCAARCGEVPVGAVIVKDGKILARAYNTRETRKNALHHAELKVIGRACEKLGGWRLPGCELYVTLEPCPMCAGAIVNARIEKVWFGAWDPKAGAFGSLFDINTCGLNHRPAVEGGVLESDCAALLSNFFLELRRGKSVGRTDKKGEN